MSEKKETAYTSGQFLSDALEGAIAEWFLDDVRHYGDLRAQEAKAELLYAIKYGHLPDCTFSYLGGTPCNCVESDVSATYDQAVENAKDELLAEWRAWRIK